MITFKTIRWKNLLSTGNIFTEIDLNNNQTSLIVGANGHGKSTILDAITFVLFGKPFRKINKPGLVNSVNNKDCVVEIEFSAYGKEYKIIRGIKPNIFEIWVDDTMINQDSASRDYQDYLEKHILKMNMKSFCQIVILGSASFTPFMQLSANDRRTIIEDLLDIQVFSVMNILVKQRFQENKDFLERNKIELTSAKDKKAFVEKTLASLKSNNNDKIKELIKQKEEFAQQKKDLLDKVQILADEREELIKKITDLPERRREHGEFLKLKAQWEIEQKHKEKEKDFYSHSDNCPTCKQKIDEIFKKDRVKELNTEIQSYMAGLIDNGLTIHFIADRIFEMETHAKRIDVISNEIKSSKHTMMHYVSMINDIEDSIHKIENSDNLVKDNEDELASVNNLVDRLEARKNMMLNERVLIDTALSLLKDGGIKTKIIKQYIPIINKVVNKYLSQMGFFVNFNIDENFNEVIKSRHRDEFAYDNFSEGEKTRIDLALMFTWRTIAKMKNSVNTNLLILDEILDGSLDANGTDEFLKIIKSLTDGTNTFIISHKQDQLLDKFDKVYRFEKVKNFSRLS